ncbi:hypothetical protein F6455_01055 [Proteobacteria bacterium 005FR1]|nr:hypothetical protein [Proteobacteria bacterium 005FR1]
MRIILSRKGFDSTAGGCPSPIFPDGTLSSLPIPDKKSPISYGQLVSGGVNTGDLVQDLTGGKWKPEHRAHLDPDLNAATLERKPGWRGLLGQAGSAQGHLRAQQIGPGDLFLFFGLFRNVEQVGGRWTFAVNSRPRHVLWGWLQIDRIVPVDDLAPDELAWARYHPHFQYGEDRNNTLYIATEQLVVNGTPTGLAGAGTFEQLMDKLVLTAPDARLTSFWKLPSLFYPSEHRQLSYHLDLQRWKLDGETCYLQSAGRGQEFVLDGAEESEVGEWLQHLLEEERSAVAI